MSYIDPLNLPPEDQCPECLGVSNYEQHARISPIHRVCTDWICEDCDGIGTLEAYRDVCYRRHIDKLIIKRYRKLTYPIPDYWFPTAPS